MARGERRHRSDTGTNAEGTAMSQARRESKALRATLSLKTLKTYSSVKYMLTCWLAVTTAYEGQ